ncbi:MAG: hypothetical protein IT204_20765 [Fimbriimonadaceae bacterium]|nr:hypothetical protein [Fimbriimonadaceae bacterium]
MLTSMALCLLLATPWWDDFPTTVQTSDPAVADAVGASSVLCGLADDPCWGIPAARVRELWLAPRRAALAGRDRVLLSWVETFGTTQAYAVALRRGPDGKLVGSPGDPTLPPPVYNHWSWQLYQPGPDLLVRWLGLGSYLDAEEWLGPWTRHHPRYGVAPFRYPDGRPASGLLRPGDPSSHRLYDAACAKDIRGELQVDWQINDGAQGRPQPDLVAVTTPPGERRASGFSYGKDPACPHWIDYAAASARYLVDAGMRGVWADNFSAWDGFGNPPLRHAFGDWAVAGFRDWLRAAGQPVVADYDVRAALRRLCRERFGGVDEQLNHPAWRDPRWLDEPLWRQYLCYQQATGRQALQRYHDALQAAAREQGIDDFGIQGNDIPIYAFGMPRPSALEMVSTELSPGWNLLSGPRGLGLPPRGRLGPVIRLARVHAASRFVHVWYYLEGPGEPFRGDAALGRVLSYELLANHAMIQAYPSNARVPGTNATHAEVNRWIAAVRPVWGDRQPLAQIGLLYSPDSQLAAITPGGCVDFAAQRHSFDLLGWGTLLSERQAQYEVLPAWDLTAARLAGLQVLLLPSVECLDPTALREVLGPWVSAGGRLVVSGLCGGRLPASGALERRPDGCPELTALAAAPGRGAVLRLPARGFEYYQTAPAARRLEPWQHDLEAVVAAAGEVAAGLPRELEVVLYHSPSQPRLFVEVANLAWAGTPAAAPAPQTVTLRLTAPGRAVGELRARLLSPTAPTAALPVRQEGAALLVGPLTVEQYGSVVIDNWRTPGGPL